VKHHGAARDRNEPEIVDKLRKLGVTVFRMDQSGIPDLLIYFRGFQCFLEVKQAGAKKESREDKRRSQYRPPGMTANRLALLTPSQRNFVCDWPGAWQIVMSFEEAWSFIHVLVFGAGWSEEANKLGREENGNGDKHADAGTAGPGGPEAGPT
jgi:hypothetical protein